MVPQPEVQGQLVLGEIGRTAAEFVAKFNERMWR